MKKKRVCFKYLGELDENTPGWKRTETTSVATL